MSTDSPQIEQDQGSKGPLHIGIVTETYPPEINGVARTLSRIVANLSSRGHHVTMVRPRQGREDRGEDESIARTELISGVPIPWYPALRAGWPSAIKLHRLWKAKRPDILYVATEGPLGLAAVLIARRLEIPVVSGFHTNFPSYSTHYQIGFLKPLIMGYLRFFHNRTGSTLVPTQELKQQLEEEAFIDVDVLGRGVDLHHFSPEKRSHELRKAWGADDESPVVLYVGRLATEKNIELAIKAYDAMREINQAIRFVFVGDGPMRHELGDDRDDFIFAGEHVGESLARYYASADIFLFPSETETFGNVTLEALSSGLALVAFDYAAAREVGRHNENGLFVPLGDNDRYRDEAMRLMGDPRLMQKLKNNARETILTCGWNRIFDRFESILYKQLKIPSIGGPVQEAAGS